MHEFGHLLHLHHGGKDAINFKANYLSVMNYNWTLSNGVSDLDAVIAGGSPRWSGASFSRYEFDEIDENNFDECKGFFGQDLVRGPASHPVKSPTGASSIELGPVDINQNGICEGESCTPSVCGSIGMVSKQNVINDPRVDVNGDNWCVRPGLDGKIQTNPLGDDEITRLYQPDPTGPKTKPKLLVMEYISFGQDRKCDTLGPNVVGDDQIRQYIQMVPFQEVAAVQPSLMTGLDDFEVIEKFAKAPIALSASASAPKIEEEQIIDPQEVSFRQRYMATKTIPSPWIEIEAQEPLASGENGEFQIEVGNSGYGPARDATLVFSGPAGEITRKDIGNLGIGKSARLDLSYPIEKSACPRTDLLTLNISTADLLGNVISTRKEVEVSIVDKRKPIISPRNRTKTLCDEQPGPIEIFLPTVSDNCDSNVQVRGEITSYQNQVLKTPTPILASERLVLRPGEYTLTWTARDASGNIEELKEQVLVRPTFAFEQCCHSEGQPDKFIGTNDPDFMVSSFFETSEFQWFDGAGGRDLLKTGWTEDCLLGGSENDTIISLGGDDRAVGGSGEDDIHLCKLGAGDVQARGNSGDDSIRASGCSSATIWGGPGNDSVIGSNFGDDKIYPGMGADFVDARSGDDTVYIRHHCEVSPGEVLIGGFGNDTLVVGTTLEAIEDAGVLVLGFEHVVLKPEIAAFALCIE